MNDRIKKISRYILFALAAFGFGILGSIFHNKITPEQSHLQADIPEHNQLDPKDYSYTFSRPVPANQDFIEASNKARPAVVFIKSIQKGVQRSYSYWDLFFDYFMEPGPITNQGSGVIISSDGYIVTNNHVIQNADKIEVVINGRNKNYTAEVVGTASSSDLALLKISAKNLPYVEFANSEEVQVGEWVLAVGNPFNLTSTVTSGIVSAKGRNINILKNNNFPIESFIQTDAAINPGNSGGALVNLKGQLVGINTAILSKTGSYSGYGFAIPSNIVLKIINDFKEFGMIQRAFMEAEIVDIDEEMAKKIGDIELSGVYVNRVFENGNADKAGLQKGDVILRANDKTVKSRAQFDEQLAYQRPGDEMNLEVLRGNSVKKIKVKLTNSEGTTKLLKNTIIRSKDLGASFKDLSVVDKKYYGIDYGVKVTEIKNGLLKQMSIPEGFIILTINNKKMYSAKDLVELLENFKGRLYLKGVTPDGWVISRSVRIY